MYPPTVSVESRYALIPPYEKHDSASGGEFNPKRLNSDYLKKGVHMKSLIINVNSKPLEFDRFGNQAGLNSFDLTARRWMGNGMDATGFALAVMSILTYTASHE